MTGAIKLGIIVGGGFAVGKYGGAKLAALAQGGTPRPGALQLGVQVAVGVLGAGIIAAVIGTL